MTEDEQIDMDKLILDFTTARRNEFVLEAENKRLEQAAKHWEHNYELLKEEMQSAIDKLREAQKEAEVDINWFTAHLMSRYAKVTGVNKKHIDELYLDFIGRRKKARVALKKKGN